MVRIEHIALIRRADSLYFHIPAYFVKAFGLAEGKRYTLTFEENGGNTNG